MEGGLRRARGQRLIPALVQYLFFSHLEALEACLCGGVRGGDGSTGFAGCFDTPGCCCMAFGADYYLGSYMCT